MKLRLDQILTTEVRDALAAAGYSIVHVGEVPWWMERVWSLPAEMYRLVARL